MTYTKRLANPKWQRKRLHVLERDNFTCKKCGDTETELHVHHIKYQSYNPEETDISLLDTLCSHCHYIISGSEEMTKNYDSLKIAKHLNGYRILFISSYANVLIFDVFTIDMEYLHTIKTEREEIKRDIINMVNNSL